MSWSEITGPRDAPEPDGTEPRYTCLDVSRCFRHPDGGCESPSEHYPDGTCAEDFRPCWSPADLAVEDVPERTTERAR